jgi:hypothetical protein
MGVWARICCARLSRARNKYYTDLGRYVLRDAP